MNYSSVVADLGLPNAVIPLYSPVGEAILNRTFAAKHVSNGMVEEFANQVNNVNSGGPASLALVINAISVAYRIKYMLELEKSKDDAENYLNEYNDSLAERINENDIVGVKAVKDYLRSTNIGTSGWTLQQLQNIAMYLGFGTNAHFACSLNSCQNEGVKKQLLDFIGYGSKYYLLNSTDAFRVYAKDYMMRPLTGLILNYDKSVLGYSDVSGHFSPLAAYDETTDRFLVMDVWESHPPVWILTDDLFSAMVSIDNKSGLPRGILHVHELVS